MPSQQKYLWRDIDRVDEPKRRAAKRLRDFRETAQVYDEATAREQASRCVQCPNANCVASCPLELPIPELLALTAEGRFQAAAELMFSTQSLPEFFAHVCVEGRLCEAACVLGARSEAVPIGALSRFLVDYGIRHGVEEPPPAPAKGRRVLVLGAGLCGLVAADALLRKGYDVTVMDSVAKPGGRLINGLPGFRVDRAVIERRIEILRQRGVHFHMGQPWSEHLTLGELRRAFDALFIALGRADPAPLEIPGGRLPGVHQAYGFVMQKTVDTTLAVPRVDVAGRRVLVLGGGETAMNALRVALRCEAREAACVYRRDAASLPANPVYYREAVEEGAQFHFLTQPIAVLGAEAGGVTGLRCARTRLEGTDASGRRVARPMPGTEFDLPADVVLVAHGFLPPKLPEAWRADALTLDGRGCLIVDANQMTNLDAVFAAGSIVRGPVALSDVVRDARSASVHLDRYLASRQ